MTRKSLVGRVMLAGIALMAAAGVSHAAQQNWTNTVAKIDGGHTIGNPDAPLKLTEYVSYTCPHCATFSRQADDAIKLAYVTPGRLKLEIRHLLRDPIDLTAAMLTNCGDTAKFARNHHAFMLAHPEWMAKATAATRAQKQRWSTGEEAARRRAIASDLGFYPIMEQRGYSRIQADACLADETMAESLADISKRDWQIPGMEGTPSFAINGQLLPQIHSWAGLQPALQARISASASQ
ncbi:thioredoxin domain-containing protein [Altererythrobacter xixiisoli]|uniref:Thioredoxin domain-containing protein n=1 Tax=Croceibacterium xixiisoli TaxID=1476466 RepID=A0A6I4TU18_9SPHN|nr:thioredoxin domain-containing protein [Croceibacterium xixiisoli]MXO99695.1 thioredoxin domain-containing protein [Croceibacterium xixiisoli]